MLHIFFIEDKVRPVEQEKILGMGLTPVVGIFGGGFIALIIGFVCVCLFIRRMQKRDGEMPATQPHSATSFGANTVSMMNSLCGNNLVYPQVMGLLFLMLTYVQMKAVP